MKQLSLLSQSVSWNTCKANINLFDYLSYLSIILYIDVWSFIQKVI